MNKCLIIIFFCINLCDFLTAKEPIGYRKIDDSCEISDESFKTINVISNHGLADSCSLLISASPEADDDFDIQLRITKDSNICDTGIEYVDTENPKITSVKDDGVVICSFKIYLNIIEKLEKTQGFKYFGKYWKITNLCQANFKTCLNTNLFFMNTVEWWEKEKYNYLDLRASMFYWHEYSAIDYHV
ncbi:uncharacterized protein LOC122849932 [Aphidius gifuensis]|uniref:uncharacterized protein LOC122849932 n=1 Tax=Aphidius gifuensis TaxID=684658 RepID=UPI001CDB7A86|nr:uncharacterized protein LOC122849932 [Aphidius gifuensis]